MILLAVGGRPQARDQSTRGRQPSLASHRPRHHLHRRSDLRVRAKNQRPDLSHCASLARQDALSLAQGEAMGRRSKAGGEPAKAQRRKTGARKGRIRKCSISTEEPEISIIEKNDTIKPGSS
jgi:hypothetical protein